MGQEIAAVHFRHYDFHRFSRVLAQEMETLHEWFESDRFSKRRGICGLELEAWLVDSGGLPRPVNDEVIRRLGAPNVVHELSRFNIEFNVEPQPVAGSGLRALCTELAETWRRCDEAAAADGTSIMAIGTLPTVTDDMLSLRNMSPLHRYHALNEQVLRLRQGRPIRLAIRGREHLETEHQDVMLEAGATSFQIHLQVPAGEAVRVWNAATILSAPLVAISANSPFLFGRHLWDETRIPLFEQAINVGGGRFSRVTFGSSFGTRSLEGCFCENRDHYPVMLPLTMDEPSDRMAHVRLHNGTIWRWNRPLIGFDGDGTPHLRIEHRVMAAGPTLEDMAANMALYFGLVESLTADPVAPESRLSFATVRENFYAAARSGLDAEIVWLDHKRWELPRLIYENLLPLADAGLTKLGVNEDDARRWLGIIESRARSGQNGAAWQRRFVARHGSDWGLLTREYRDRQRSGEPVHTWSI
jgi:gamma-glutamyl:cysteine ligase YbdK (ATP-grasp superfamily)